MDNSVAVCLMVIGPPGPRPAPPPPAPPRCGGGSLFSALYVHVPEKSGLACAHAATGMASASASTNKNTRRMLVPPSASIAPPNATGYQRRTQRKCDKFMEG